MTRRALLLTAGLAVLSAACGAAAQGGGDISSPKLRVAWAEFKKLHESGKVVVVDVRDEASFAAGHIPGATNIPGGEVEKRARELKKLKRPIVTYCA